MTTSPGSSRWDIFCTVIDNYGDIGVCWRLARQLAAEHGIAVRLWLDDPVVLGKMAHGIDVAAEAQHCCGVEVRRWDASFPSVEPADVVVEAFACDPPRSYVEAMALRDPKPAWINLEYLSAEDWVKSCHGVPSPHPRLPLTKYFFFPGFGMGTGGLLRERDLLAQRDEFLSSLTDQAEFWRSMSLGPVESGEIRISLFSYPHPALPELLEEWAGGSERVTCLIPEKMADQELQAFFGEPRTMWERGSLRVRVFPFLEQDRYDKLLWACDCNFVRGEDSFVRAQWAGRPYVWQIYPQEADAHWVKLEAFLAHYTAGLAPDAAQALRSLWVAWNRGEGVGRAWGRFRREWPALERAGAQWEGQLVKLGDLATNLVQFCKNQI